MKSTYIINCRSGKVPEPISSIPVAFGFDPVDAKEIISACCQKLSEEHLQENFPVLLTKAVVKECVQRLSKSYFNDASHTIKKHSCLDYSAGDSGRVNIPIPYKAAYILQKQGYPMPQIAEFLNTSVVKVSQHLALARQYMANAA